MMKKQDTLLNVLKKIEPRLTKLSIILVNGEPIIHGDIGLNRLLPLPLLGDGIGRVLSISLAIMSASDGVILLDEVENGLHYSIHSKVWSSIDLISEEFNVQVFATTHSSECVTAAHNAFGNGKSQNFRLHRLDKKDNGEISVTTYGKNELKTAVESEFEVR